MFRHLPSLVLGMALTLFSPLPAGAQPDNVNFRFSRGQPLQPIYEGWQRNPDGTISMYFGYINRNYAQDLSIPIGPDNNFTPGPADRGQPTFLYSRIRRQAFSVTLPADWGRTQELTWTVVANGTPLRAVGWMQAEWEIDPVFGGQTQNEERRANKAPTLAVEAAAAVSLANGLMLSATVVDDGLPRPKAKRGVVVGQESPPAIQALPDQAEIPVNVPEAFDPNPRRRAELRGPGVTWIVWRGPASVDFSVASPVEVKAGKAVVTVTFNQPGTYVLRAKATDGDLFSDHKDVTVTVTP